MFRRNKPTNDVVPTEQGQQVEEEEETTSAASAPGGTDAICRVPLTHKTKEKSVMTKTMHHLRDYTTAVKHGRVFKPYSYTERKVRAATRNTTWGPHGGELVELAQLSHRHQECGIIFGVLEERFRCPPEKWNNVNKALCVLEYLVQRGSDEVLTWAVSDMMMRTLERLEGFSYVTADKVQRDVGATVRQRAKAIRGLLLDHDKLEDARKRGSIQSMRMAGMHVGDVYDDTSTAREEDNEGHDRSSCSDEDEDVEGHVLEGQAHEVKHERTLSRESTKGVSDEDNSRHIIALKSLLERPENGICVDCGLKGMGSRPTWASISLGVFMCLRCAGIHRSLGVHISQVRSCCLDVWAYHQLEFMARCGGNQVANAYWEHDLDKKPQFLTIGDLESFIRDKYVEKKYCNSNVAWPPEDDEYIDEETWGVLQQAMNEQQLADFHCRQGELDKDAHGDLDKDEKSDEKDVLISLLDEDHVTDLIGDSDLLLAPPHHSPDSMDPFWDGQFAGISHEQQQITSDVSFTASSIENHTMWDMSFTTREDMSRETSTVDECIARTVDNGGEVRPKEDHLASHECIHTGSNLRPDDTDGLARTLEYLGLSAKTTTTKEEKRNDALTVAGAQVTKNNKGSSELKPHERKARDLLAGTLRDFDLAAGIASVSPKALSMSTKASKEWGCPMVKK